MMTSINTDYHDNITSSYNGLDWCYIFSSCIDYTFSSCLEITPIIIWHFLIIICEVFQHLLIKHDILINDPANHWSTVCQSLVQYHEIHIIHGMKARRSSSLPHVMVSALGSIQGNIVPKQFAYT